MFGVNARQIAKTAQQGNKILHDINENIAKTQRNFQEIVQVLQGMKDEMTKIQERLAKLEGK